MTEPVSPFPALLKERYRFKSFIGSGGFASVYLAEDSGLYDRLVVIKVLRENQGSSDWIEKNFRRECEALSRIGHPGVVGVRDWGSTPEGKPFLVLDYVDGVTLRSLIKESRGGMDLRRAASFIRQIAQALTAAHEAGVYHRDLKPENIMVGRFGDGLEWPVIIDFGIATVFDSTVSVSTTIRVAGTPPYMAPEQLRGRPEAASDIFALGVIAYEMVTGRHPFDAKTFEALSFQQERGPQDPCTLRMDLTAADGEAILRALSFHATSRYSRAVEFGVEFERGVARSDATLPELQTRVLDVGMQEQLPIYETAELVALIRLVESGGLRAVVKDERDYSITPEDVRSKAFEIEFTRDPAGRLKAPSVTLSVESPDFEPKQQSKTILVPPDRDSEPCNFLLTPQHLGELRLTVEVRLNEVHIASRILKTHVEASKRMTIPGRVIVSIPMQVVVDVRAGKPLAALAGAEATAEALQDDGEGGGRHLVFEAAGSDPPSSSTILTSLEGAVSSQASVSRPGQQGGKQVQALVRAGQELAGRGTLKDLFSLILDLAVDAVGAQRGVIMTLENESLEVKANKGEGFRISAAVRDRVMKEKASVLVRDAQLDEAFRERTSIVEQKVRTLMAVPLQTATRTIGLIYVDSPNMFRAFTKDDLNLLTVLANVAATGIEHARLAEVQEMERGTTRELDQAAEIQRSSLPSGAPKVPGADLAGYNAACRAVGGDYFDFFSYPGGRVAMVLGDVSAKGMPASLMMMGLRARAQVLADEPRDLSAVMTRLNRVFCENSPSNSFIAFFLCVLDPSTGTLVYCNAGHNLPFIVRANGTVQRLEGGGPVLGILSVAEYPEYRVMLDQGDTVAIYSNGVTDANNSKEEEFGEERLVEVLKANRQKSAGWSCGPPKVMKMGASGASIVCGRSG